MSLCEGRVRFLICGERGGDFLVSEIEAGHVLGAASLLTQRPQPVLVEAATPCLVRVIPRAIAARILKEPSVAGALLQQMGEEVIAAWECLALLSSPRSAQERLLWRLWQLGPNIVGRSFSRVELAACIGICPETLSRLIGPLVQSGVFERQGRTFRVRAWEVLAAQLEKITRSR